MEDTVTYVDEPESFDTHLANLERLRGSAPSAILPNHGDPEVIAGRWLHGRPDHGDRALHPRIRGAGEQPIGARSLTRFVAEPLEAGQGHYFAPMRRPKNLAQYGWSVQRRAVGRPRRARLNRAQYGAAMDAR